MCPEPRHESAAFIDDQCPSVHSRDAPDLHRTLGLQPADADTLGDRVQHGVVAAEVPVIDGGHTEFGCDMKWLKNATIPRFVRAALVALARGR